MFYINYPTMYKVHMHAGTIRKLLYGYAYVREIIHSLKLLVEYLPLRTQIPYSNIQFFTTFTNFTMKCLVVCKVYTDVGGINSYTMYVHLYVR